MYNRADFWLTLLFRFVICAVIFFMGFGTYNWIASLVRERKVGAENRGTGEQKDKI